MAGQRLMHVESPTIVYLKTTNLSQSKNDPLITC